MYRRLSTIPAAAAALTTAFCLTACATTQDSAQSAEQTTTRSETAPITLTLMRHAESAGNASGLIDTSVPGPGITDKGRQEAQAAADRFSGQDFDGVYASSMVRTQQTAEYMAHDVSEPVEVLPGLREIEAGQYEGQPEATAQSTYLATPVSWLQGHRDDRIPGSIDGNEFDQRFDDAVEQIFDSGDTHPIAFAHGGSIMIWTLMNVNNPDPSLLKTNPLRNTGYVVITGTPDTGWTLVDWNGTPIAH
ncbi:histidine phosphatase family protein [Rhodococcus sp. NCIMB 12038]|uniref:histidine phosphatase family protein n=1 Tax=Rhodococcus sp. NCIMB 12038 TaxID=933800 RepID=UPI000B3CCE2D|nr:histidine phosphatase family protein [Rhodococcus sp. NCIMB 12038]OUS92239.1 histidine phosphatase family protein [Rhodococcus sp. NCIMB 12038]